MYTRERNEVKKPESVFIKKIALFSSFTIGLCTQRFQLYFYIYIRVEIRNFLQLILNKITFYLIFSHILPEAVGETIDDKFMHKLFSKQYNGSIDRSTWDCIGKQLILI